jgi:hypothetical protein
MRKAVIRRWNFSILEMMAVIAALAVFSAAALAFFYKGQKSCLMWSERAFAEKSVPVIEKAFRLFTHESASPMEVSADKIICPGDSSAEISEGKITFKTASGERSVRIPEQMTAGFALEQNPDGELFVLTLRGKSGSGKACGGPVRIAARPRAQTAEADQR